MSSKLGLITVGVINIILECRRAISMRFNTIKHLVGPTEKP